jgi:hypothetical protein
VSAGVSDGERANWGGSFEWIANKLVEDGTMITESTIINEYLDDAYLEPMAKSRRI